MSDTIPVTGRLTSQPMVADDPAAAAPDARRDGFVVAGDVLTFWARHRESSLAYLFLKDGEVEDAAVTYGELERRARMLAGWLRDNGASGERALLLYPAGIDFLVAFFGCLYAGTIAVPLYPPRPNRRDQRIVDIALDARAGFALTTSDIAATLERASREHSPELASLRAVATDSLAHGGAAVDRGQGTVIDPHAVAYLQYTSGSTRTPKGVMVTHRNLLAQFDDLDATIRHPPDSVFVTWLPHFHDMGLVYGLLMPLWLGCCCYFMPPASFLQQPARWLTAVTRYRATHSGAPNFAYELCTQRVTGAQKTGLELQQWVFAFSGAEPVRAKTLDDFAASFAACGLSRTALSPAYGLAEATLKVTVEPPGREPKYLSIRATGLLQDRVIPAARHEPDAKVVVGCGVAATTEILIVNPHTQAGCRGDEVGEIWLRGDSVADGYWARPDESRLTFQASPAGGADGRRYLRTGDLGFLHEGELFVTGRLKDLIIIRGRNHYPQDIELTVLQSHPAFRSQSAAAFSVEVDDEERLVVVQEVNRHHRDLDVAEAATRIRQSLAEEHELTAYALVFVTQNGVPRTSSGKVQRGPCRRAFLEGTLPVMGEWREQPETIATAEPAEAARSAGSRRTFEEIEAFVCRRLASLVGLTAEDIDLQQPFNALGVDSARALTLLGEVEVWLGRSLSPTLFWNYPTVADLAAHLAQSDGDDIAAMDAHA